ncbi:hypothetical protein [Mycolicibacterium sp. S2-37]|nr:hypothetical protein [Mycolicibacterium sp. S2-37]
MVDMPVQLVGQGPAWPRKFAEERDRVKLSMQLWLPGPIQHV